MASAKTFRLSIALDTCLHHLYFSASTSKSHSNDGALALHVSNRIISPFLQNLEFTATPLSCFDALYMYMAKTMRANSFQLGTRRENMGT